MLWQWDRVSVIKQVYLPITEMTLVLRWCVAEAARNDAADAA